MATSLQLSTGAAVVTIKQCTSAPAACGSAVSNGSLLQRDFTRTLLVSSSVLHPKASEQVRVSKGKRVTTSASAGRELNGGRIPRTKQLAKGAKRDTSAAAGGSSGVLERQAAKGVSEGVEPQMKRCIECQYVKPLVDFQKAGKGLRRSCRACVAVELAQQAGKGMAHMAMRPQEAWAKARACTKCGVTKELRDFAVNKKSKDGVQRRCRACNASATVDSSPAGAEGSWTNLAQTNNEHIHGGASNPFNSNVSTAPVEASRGPMSISEVFASQQTPQTILDAPMTPMSFSDVPSFFGESTFEAEPVKEAIPKNVPSDAAETIANLQVKLLRLDFDLANARANKAIFDDQVQYLERVMAGRTDENEKLKSALAEASAAVNELETHVARLEDEGRTLRGNLLRMDFDLTHARATRALLGERVDDLERAIAADTEATRLRDESLKTALEEATSSNAALKAELEATQEAASTLRRKVLDFSLDLTNASFGKKMLSEKVDDLERMLTADREAAQAREEKVAAALEEAALAISELDHLREEGSSLRSKLLRSDFDLAHASAHKALLNERVEDFERAMAEIREEEAELKAAFERATAANAELEAQVEALQKDQTNLRSQVLRFSLDLAHTKFVKDLLGDKVDDLERAAEEHEETMCANEETLKAAIAEASSSIAEVERLREEGTTLRGMILRLDLDLAHARSHKQILGDRVEDLEKEMVDVREDDVKMKTALAEAIAQNAALEAEVALVQAEGSALRSKVLRLSLDLAHDSAMRKILDVRVEDLEKKIEENAMVLQAKEEELRNSLDFNAELEADVKRLTEEGDHFKTQALRRDFDIQHTHALKKIFEDRVQDLERVITAYDDAHAQLKEALDSKAELVDELQHLDEEKSSLMSQLLMKDFDLTHTNALQGLLNGRISDLEGVIEAHEDLGEKLKAEKSFSAELQSEVEELKVQGDGYLTKLLRQDFDLTHIRAMKKIYEDRIGDLESVIAEHDDLGTKLKAADFSMAELEAQVAQLEQEKGAYAVEVLSKDFDLTHTRAMKSILEARLNDLERVIAAHDDLGSKLEEEKGVNAELQAEVDRLEAEKTAAQTNLLLQDFDLTHTKAMKGLLDNRIDDLERVIAAHEDLGAQLKEAHAVNSELQATIEELQAREGELQSKLLRKDFDLAHIGALKALLDDRVQGLERSIADGDERFEKLKAALAEAAVSTAELERLREEGSALQLTMLTKDFDLSHERAGKALLADKVDFLERMVANYEQVAEVRDTKLSEAVTLIEELEAQRDGLETEQGALRSKLLRQEFDLTHAIATRDILSDRVDDLQAEGEKLNTALADALSSKAELEGKITNLETALAAVRKEERALRTSQAELRRQVTNLQSDTGALTRQKMARSSMLQEKERQLKNLEAALSRAQKEGAYLVRQLTDVRAVREQRRSEGPEYDSEDIGKDREESAVAFFRKLGDVQLDQQRQYLDQDLSDDEGSSVGKQLAKIASAQAAFRRSEEAAEANKTKNATDEDEDAAAERKASRTYQAAGASVLLATVLGTYMSWAPQVNAPVRTSVPRSPLEQLVAPNPIEQLADVPESEEPSEGGEASADSELPVSNFVEEEANFVEEEVKEVSDDVKEVGEGAKEVREALLSPAEEVAELAKATLQETSQIAEAEQDAPKQSIAEADREGGLGMIFAPKENAAQEVSYDTPKEADGEEIPDCAVDMC